MANRITRSIPNALTCMNLFSGCIACAMASRADYQGALLFIVASAAFDFLDGMAARVLKAYSTIGKDLDSLADDVSFGVAPSLVVFSLLSETLYPTGMEWLSRALPYAAFLIAVFSALRLAKFNNDARQTSSFIGLPVPANALLWGSVGASMHAWIAESLLHHLIVVAGVCVSAWLLVSEIPMFSLKFKNLSWKGNKVSYSYLLVCIPLLALWRAAGFALVIVWYILLSLLVRRKAR